MLYINIISSVVIDNKIFILYILKIFNYLITKKIHENKEWLL